MELMSSFILKVILSLKIKSNPDVPSYNIHTRPEEVPGVNGRSQSRSLPLAEIPTCHIAVPLVQTV